MLQIENITLQFNDKPLLTDFSLFVKESGMVCITGESGCGKTSLLRAVMGFVPLREGCIKIAGTTLNHKSVDALRRNMAYLPQELSFPCESVREMVALPFSLRANSKNNFSEGVMFDCFERLGLDKEIYEQRLNEISGGQRQRIMLAVCAMLDKKLVLVDEPTSALDTLSSDRVINFFNELTCKGVTVLSVSHDAQFAAACNRVINLTESQKNGNK